MFYQKYTPSVALQPYIMCYFIWEHSQLLTESLEVHSPPNGLGGMVFNYGDPYHVLSEKQQWERVPYSFVAGQFTKNYCLRLSGRLGMIGVVFWPTGLSHIIGIPMVSFTNQRIDLNMVLGKEAFLLEHQILECTSKHQRISIIEKFLLRKLCKTAQKTDIIDKAVQTILQQKGILSIRQLSDDLCISSRQFQRRFNEKIGINPKLFSRIKRFNYISTFSTALSANWMDMVHEGGYYDQAHFIRDFCDFSGKKPSEFINYNRALAALVGA